MDDPCEGCNFRDENEQGNFDFGFIIKHQQFLSFADTNAGRAASLMMYEDYETPGMRLVNGCFYLDRYCLLPGRMRSRLGSPTAAKQLNNVGLIRLTKTTSLLCHLFPTLNLKYSISPFK
jgi:hypothetical protein